MNNSLLSFFLAEFSNQKKKNFSKTFLRSQEQISMNFFSSRFFILISKKNYWEIFPKNFSRNSLVKIVFIIPNEKKKIFMEKARIVKKCLWLDFYKWEDTLWTQNKFFSRQVKEGFLCSYLIIFSIKIFVDKNLIFLSTLIYLYIFTLS